MERNSHNNLIEFLIRVLLPKGGYMALFQCNSTLLSAFFDESLEGRALPITSVAGYLFAPDSYLCFQGELEDLLKEYGLEYFRFSECVHGSGQFAKYKDKVTDTCDTCDAVERRFIALVRKHAILGVGASASEATFQLVRPIESDDSLYNALCQWCLWEIGRWCDRMKFGGDIAYFFEAGHADEKGTNQKLKNIDTDIFYKTSCHYASHAFIPKKAAGVQAADMLAWFIRREAEDDEAVRLGRRPRDRRKDFKALLGNTQKELGEIEHRQKHITEEVWRSHFRDNSFPEARWY